MKNKKLENFFFYSIAIGIVISLTGTLLDFFPNSKGLFSHDYAFLAYNFDSAIWIKKNGWFSIPWFSPSFCGGLPKFADPQNSHYSIHNFLIYYLGPITGTISMFLLTAISALTFCYLFLKKILKANQWISLLGACIFVLNSFFISRMIIGHTTFVSFMSVFMLLYFIFGIKDWILSILYIAFTVASFVYGGSVFIVITCFMVCAIVALYLDITNRYSLKSSAVRILAGFSLAGVFSLMKLYATHSYYSKFSKDFYPLPGLDSIFEAFIYPLKLLIFTPPAHADEAVWTNIVWAIQRHELEYVVGITPFMIISIFIIKTFLKRTFSYQRPNHATFFKFISMSFLLLVPVMLNYYQVDLNNLYKKIPVINQLVAPTRWYSIYIPLCVILAIDLLRRMPGFFTQPLFILAMFSITIGQFQLTDRSFYESQTFNAAHILKAFSVLEETGKTHKIAKIIIPGIYEENNELTVLSMLNANEPFLYGYSSTRCYSPIFGYRLEILPKMNLINGSVFKESDGYLNINDPRCYLFPEINSCKPGDRFMVTDSEVVNKFVNYTEIPFKIPWMQHFAQSISVISIVLGCVLVLLRMIYFRNKPRA